jgi:hypothetical protein
VNSHRLLEDEYDHCAARLLQQKLPKIFLKNVAMTEHAL